MDIHCISVFLLLIFLLRFSFVFGIKCWVCHSDSDPKCADPFDNTTLPIKDCREVKRTHLFESWPDESPYETLVRKTENRSSPYKKATMCRKIRQKIHGNWRTIRDCAFIGLPGEGTGNEHNCLYKRGIEKNQSSINERNFCDTGTYDIYLEYCTCDSKDGCNIAFQTQMSYVLLVSVILCLIVSSIFVP